MADFSNDKYLSAPENKNILQPYLYLNTSAGENIGGIFISFLNYWMQVPLEKVEKISDLIIHFLRVCFIIDDVQDNTNLRRGKPAAHKVYGVPRTLQSMQFMHFVLIEKCLDLGHPKAIEWLTTKLVDMYAGQGIELYWRDNFICPTEDEYLAMTEKKTGSVLELSIELMQLFSDKRYDVLALRNAFGAYIQVANDYGNLTSEKYFTVKGFCDDITEGKFSFPIVHAINNFPEEGEIIKGILSKRTKNVEEKKRCIALLNQCGSFEYTRQKLDEFSQQFFNEIAKMGYNPNLKSYMNGFTSIVCAWHKEILVNKTNSV